LRIDPNCREAYLAAAALALDKQDYDLAANQYRKSLERFGDDPDMHCGLVERIAVQTGRFFLSSRSQACPERSRRAEESLQAIGQENFQPNARVPKSKN